MAQFAVIKNGIVVNSIVADNKLIAEEVTGMTCIASEDAGIGWTYDSETGEFTAPVMPAEEPAVTEELAPVEEAPVEEATPAE